MQLRSEWAGRLRHWLNALERDFYFELGELDFQGFETFERLTLQEAEKCEFASFSAGTDWGREWQYLWLKADIELPPEAEGRKIVLNLNPGGETTIFINGEPFGTYRDKWVVPMHHYMEDNIISENGREGEKFHIVCEAYAGHFIPSGAAGALAPGPVRPDSADGKDPLEGKTRTKLGWSSFGIWNEDAYSLWLDIKVLSEIMTALPDSSLRAARIARALQNFMLNVDFEKPRDERISDYIAAKESLFPVLSAVNGTSAPVFYAVGNAHIDVVWLWPLEETIRKTARTFSAQLRLIEKYPEYKFIQSQPLLYEMCKEHYPDVYEKIKKAAKMGSWICEGGMWVEPDTNMPSGEALIRQLLYGKRFFREEFSVESELLWLPDSFGYSAALPQILKGCGIKYLVTQKIFWSYNDGDPFPYHYFTWQGSDGSQITSYLPTDYTYTTNPAKIISVWDNRAEKDDMDKFLYPFGYGDGGGGPSREFIESALREKDIEGCPRVKIAHPAELFRDLEKDGGPEHTYAGELYFNAHRGVYTSQAGVKCGNRKSEQALREAEMWCAMAFLRGWDYPAKSLEEAWKKVLLNQFHDILPGSSIARVYDEAAVIYKEAIETAERLTAEAAGAVVTGEGTAIFNSLSWQRGAIVSLPEGFENGAIDFEGRKIPVVRTGTGTECETLAYVTLPPCGFVTLTPSMAAEKPADYVRAEACSGNITLENEIIRTKINESGEISSFILKETGREIASGEMNKFKLFKDVPRTFDAWDIDSNYELQPVEIDLRAEVTLLYTTPLKAAVKVKKLVSNSSVEQIISLCAGSRRLEFDTKVEWNELHKLLKVSFPANVVTEEAINEIQYGFIKRPAHRSRAYEKDRFEVCNHRYTAVCDENHGAAVLNDCKYGVSMLGGEISLTLLRAAASPEMRADNGTHNFVYAFTAWESCFFESMVVREGYELNTPLVLSQGFGKSESYFQTEAHNIIIDEVKKAENGNGIIVRLYESKHADTACRLDIGFSAGKAYLTDMLENITGELDIGNSGINLHFRPFEVKTVLIYPESEDLWKKEY